METEIEIRVKTIEYQKQVERAIEEQTREDAGFR
jgi:hypothetical protein